MTSAQRVCTDTRFLSVHRTPPEARRCARSTTDNHVFTVHSECAAPQGMLVSASFARAVFGVSFPDLAHPPWCYAYRVSHDEWVFIGAPSSPKSVIDSAW